MKLKTYFLLFVCLFAAAAISAYVSNKKARTRAETGFVFIELFTSEGCSSCPPAEQLVEKIMHEHAGTRVYIASYHVDYWDRLGWKDRFSKHDYSVHQYEYAKQFHLNSVYTPQIVVNGQSEFVGSNEIALRSAIRSSFGGRESAHIELSRLEAGADKCSVHYLLKEAENTASLTFVLLQKKALINIKAGENNGRTITHVNIVRETRELPAGQFSGDFSIVIPEDLGNNWELLCYAKNHTTGQILSAQKVPDTDAGVSVK